MGSTGFVAIVFTDVVGSTDLVARLGEQPADRLRQAHFALLRVAIAEGGGTEVKNLGDGLMVAFAAASDAVACAVAMQQAVDRNNRSADEVLGMRVGLAAGEVTLEGSDYFGTPVIEAARLCSTAEGGQILVTEMARAVAGSRGAHRFEALGPMALKGLPDPVSVHQVAWEPRVETGPPLPPRLALKRSDVFVGRADERQALERAWKRAASGARQVVFLAGEPGIGKTRLATEVALGAHHQGALVLLGTCNEDLARPYEPFVEALRHLVTVLPEGEVAEELAGQGGELARLLPELPQQTPGLRAAQAGDPDTERYLLFSAVSRLLAAASRVRPVLLFLDDLQWATKPTVLLLKHLLCSAEPMALLVVGTYRNSDVGRDHPLVGLLADLRREEDVERVALRGLSDVASLALMEGLAGHEFDGTTLELAHAVSEETDGSPFFIRELLRYLAESGELVQEGDRWTYTGELSNLGIPESVREVIGRRLSRLPEDAERLLTLGAVIGREFDLDVLVPLAGMSRPKVIEALDPARRANLVREVSASRFIFVHALIRNTLYEELGLARRTELHRAVGETLESLGGDLSDLAHHWTAATPALSVSAADMAKAAGYAEAAGRRAMASLAYEEAIHHFEVALRAGDPARRCELLIDLGEAQRCAGDAAHRETLLEAGRLALEGGDPDRGARAALANQRGVFSRMGAVDGERVAALEASLASVGSATTPVRAQLLASLATELHFEDEERRLELAREALEVARRVDDPATLAKALAALCLAAWGSSAQAIQGPLAEELSELAGRLGDRTLAFHANVAVFYSATGRGELERADEALSVCRRIAGQLGQPVLGWRVTHLEMHRAMAVGCFQEVEHWAAEALRLGEAAGQPDRLPYARGALAITRILEGRAGEVEELLASVIEQFPGAVVYLGMQAWAFAEEGRLDQARAILTRLREPKAFAGVPRDHHRPLTLCLLSRACYRIDDGAIAAELHDLLIPLRSHIVNGQTSWIGPATHDLGLLATTLGRYDEAQTHFGEAIEVQDRMGARGTVVHTRLAWARMLLSRARRMDTPTARTLLAEAKTGARDVNIPDVETHITELLTQLSK